MIIFCRLCLLGFIPTSTINHHPSSLFMRASPARSQLTQPSLTVREGFYLPPAPSLSREGSNRDCSSLIH